MPVAKIQYFDQYGMHLQEELRMVPGTQPGAVQEFIRNGIASNVMNIPIAYAYVEFQETKETPVLVVI